MLFDFGMFVFYLVSGKELLISLTSKIKKGGSSMFSKSLSQGLIVMGLIFIFAIIIDLVTPLQAFNTSSLVSFLAFFIVYVGITCIKNKHAKK